MRGRVGWSDWYLNKSNGPLKRTSEHAGFWDLQASVQDIGILLLKLPPPLFPSLPRAAPERAQSLAVAGSSAAACAASKCASGRIGSASALWLCDTF